MNSKTNTLNVSNYYLKLEPQDCTIIEISEKKQRTKLALKNGRQLYLLSFEDILYIKADSNYSIIFFLDHNILTSKTLKHWEEKFNNAMFLRCHHKYLVNTSMIVNVNMISKLLQLSDETFIPIARRRMSEIIKLISKN